MITTPVSGSSGLGFELLPGTLLPPSVYLGTCKLKIEVALQWTSIPFKDEQKYS